MIGCSGIEMQYELLIATDKLYPSVKEVMLNVLFLEKKKKKQVVALPGTFGYEERKYLPASP